ncbi:MAG: hypothetical protein P4L59_00370 [Desulfosporosinus sp.]|nr:hypothetical protein [Desulfosporosinus sp.]
MIIFKAIEEKDKPILSSSFQGEFKDHACVTDLIKSAMGHIKVANQKRKNRSSDYWYSATNDYFTALKYLNEHRNDEYHYSGIALIELSNTDKSGYIYDDSLRVNGYIEKEIIGDEIVCKWKPNADGIVWVLDMSSQDTVDYLASILWLKGNDSTFRDFRVLRTSNKDQEFLILGENIKYEFIDSDKANKFHNQFIGVNNFIYNWHTELFWLFISNAPDSAIKRQLFNEYYVPEKYENDEYHAWELWQRWFEIEDESNWGDNSSYIDKTNEQNRLIRQFYGIAEGLFSKKRADKRFKEFHQLEYIDKDIIDFDEYDPIRREDFIDFQMALDAYIYSGKDRYKVMKTLERSRFRIIVLLYKEKYPEIFNDDIWEYYKYVNKLFHFNKFRIGIFKDEI